MDRVDRRDVRDVRTDAGDQRCCSAACSQDALSIMRANDSMQPVMPTDALSQSNIGQIRNGVYPPPLALDNSCGDPDKEEWRRYNPFDKHYVGNGAGAIGPYDRSPNPQYQLNCDPQSAGGEYRVTPYRSNGGQYDNSYCPDPYSRNGDNSYQRDPYNSGYADNPYQRNPYNSGYADNSYQRNPYDNPYRRNPSDQPLPDRYPAPDSNGNICRDASDRRNFYAHQNDAYSCSAFSMAMMASDWNTGHPPTNAESSRWKQIAGTIGQGYRGSLNQVAANLREGIPDLHTKVYNYGMGRVGQQAMQDLNRELAQGHTAVAKVINPHTGNAHYIYIAGRTQNGDYILGDPDRKNPHQQPVSGERLQHMMSRRDGFVAGWKDSMSVATRATGSAANRYAMSRYNGEEDNRARV